MTSVKWGELRVEGEGGGAKGWDGKQTAGERMHGGAKNRGGDGGSNIELACLPISHDTCQNAAVSPVLDAWWEPHGHGGQAAMGKEEERAKGRKDGVAGFEGR